MGLTAFPASLLRGRRRWPAVAGPAVVTMGAAAVEFLAAGAVPVGPALGGRAHALPFDRVAGVLPVGQPAGVAADVAVAVPPKGVERRHRALPVLVELVRKHPGENILVVSHKATIRLLLSSLLGFDPRRYRDNLDQKPAALNIVDFKDAMRARLTLFNDTSHCAPAHEAVPPIPERRLSRWWNERTTRANQK